MTAVFETVWNGLCHVLCSRSWTACRRTSCCQNAMQHSCSWSTLHCSLGRPVWAM